jgi:hypothetical protein
MGSHEPFGHLQHKLWQKEGPGVKLVIWFPTTKSRELTQPQCVQVECNTPLESSQWKLQIALNLVPIRGLNKELCPRKIARVQTGTILGLFLGSPRTKKPFGCRWRGEAQRILYGGRWWLPLNSGHGESCESMVASALS